jgi:hypothetical protein
MFRIENGRECFWQWDVNQRLIVDDDAITEVHFCNKTDDCALVCEVFTENGKRLVNVPNILLQQDWKIRAYAYLLDHTVVEESFKVCARSKPADYVYTETDVKNLEALLENKVDTVEDYYILYGRDGNGERAIPFAAESAKPNSIVRRNGNGRIVAEEPANSNQVVNVSYANKNYVKRRADKINGVYCRYANEDTFINFDASVSDGAIVRWNQQGNIETREPTEDLHCANKKYVDDAIYDARNTVATVVTAFDNRVSLTEKNKVDKSTENYIVYGRGAGAEAAIPFAADSAKAESVVRRNKNGAIVTANPTASNQAATKGYVDNAISAAITEVENGTY